MSSQNPKAAHSGFTLIEVLVALIVISIGLLGIAKMQALAMASTGTARMRSVAALEAASMASMMHANRAYWSAITANTTVTVTASSSSFTTTDTTVVTPAGGVCTSAAPCTAVAQMAYYDLSQWATALNQTMPSNATATLTCIVATTTAPVICTIQLNWTENLVEANTGMNTALTQAQNSNNLQATAPTHFIVTVEP